MGRIPSACPLGRVVRGRGRGHQGWAGSIPHFGTCYKGHLHHVLALRFVLFCRFGLEGLSVRVAVVGAGLAGLACAEGLAAAGHGVTLLDKGRGPGGRMSTRRTPEGWAFDHGAPWFAARDADFCAALADWEEQGLAARWPDVAGELWVGVPGMNALVAHLAGRHAVEFGVQVSALVRAGQGWMIHAGQRALGPFDAVVLAIPAEQAALLAGLHDFAMGRAAVQVASLPCWTGLFGFDEALGGADVIRDTGAIHVALRNGGKPGRGAKEAWVVHASQAWSQSHLEMDKEAVAPLLLAELAQGLGRDLPVPGVSMAHRWRFAMPRAGHGGVAGRALWNAQMRLGACGDWLAGSGVEAAWLSGRALAGLIAG